MNYKVLITTSGIGSRLGELTNYTNKSLIRVGKKPAISYIVERYPDDIELVITLGYFGDHVKDFLELAYPQKNFTFINVDKYEGEGSSLGYSMLQAKEHLQCPFIYHASDTIIIDNKEIELPDTDWVGGCKVIGNSSQYRTISLVLNSHFTINEKGEMQFDSTYIGLAGINDYINFWKSLEFYYKQNPNNQSLSDCDGLNGIDIKEIHYFKEDSWLDIGNSHDLKKSREIIPDKFEILDKVDESIFLFDDFVIKFFANKEICENRIARASELHGLVPKILGYSENFYKYEYAKGDLLADVVNENIFNNLLEYCKENLWIKQENYNINEFKQSCYEFYIKKTHGRISQYLKQNNIDDFNIFTNINGITITDVKFILNQVNVGWLCYESLPYKFHGDYILDNIIYNNERFTLIDWRQDFGSSLTDGDIYYDLAKMNHNLIFNHEIVNKELYKIEIDKNGNVICDILVSKNLLECQKILHKFIIDNGFDLKKVQVLTAIVWLNMSALHQGKLGDFLFNFGKLNLWKALNEK